MALTPLSEHADDDHLDTVPYDLRGWNVVTLVDEETVGTVHDLLLDEQRQPRYLDVDLGRLRKHVLLPVGQARADRGRRTVWVPGFTQAQFDDIPAYRHDLDGLDRGYETGLIAAYTSAYAGERHRPRPAAARVIRNPSGAEDHAITTGSLAPLSRLEEYRIAEDEPDPRGWSVLVADGTRIGEVDELIVDRTAMKVRYLVCRADPRALGLDTEDHHILIPVGYAQLDEAHESIRIGVPSASALAGLPAYDGDQIGQLLETEVRHDGGETAPSEFYRAPHFDVRRLFGPDTP